MFLGEANSSIQVMLWILVNVKGLNHKCGELGSYLNHGAQKDVVGAETPGKGVIGRTER